MGIHKFFDGGGNQVLSLSAPISKKNGADTLRKANALLRYHFKIDPDTLSDEQFSERWQELKYALDFESRRFSLKDGKNSLQI